jgi:branched-chain amino acid transport system permease protein
MAASRAIGAVIVTDRFSSASGFDKTKITVVCALAVVFPFFAGEYEIGLATTVGTFVIIGMGLNIAAGFTGQLSFGQAGFFGSGAYASALLETRLHWGFVEGTLAAMVVGAGLALLVGMLSLRLEGVFFAIATLGAAEILMTVATNWQSLTYGANGVIGIPSPSISLAGYTMMLSSPQAFYGMTALVIAAVCLLTKLITKSAIGRAMAAIRESLELSEGVGINTFGVKVVMFVIAGCVAGLAGALYAGYIGVVTPDLLGSYYSAIPLLIMVIGGMGKIAGPIVGGVLMIWVPMIFNINGATGLVIQGVALIVVILVVPGGVLGASSYAERRITARWNTRSLKDRSIVPEASPDQGEK